MQILLKLYASLGDHLPADRRRGNELPLELPEATTINEAIAPFALPPKLVHLVLINGVFIPPEQRATRALADGDVLAIWPPIAGGQDVQDPATYTEHFEREHGCTADEWRMWLPGAVAGAAMDVNADDSARIRIGDGTLRLQWRSLPPRQIALIRMPRLQVSYRFNNVAAAERARFMQRFDLYMQRGGG